MTQLQELLYIHIQDLGAKTAAYSSTTDILALIACLILQQLLPFRSSFSDQ